MATRLYFRSTTAVDPKPSSRQTAVSQVVADLNGGGQDTTLVINPCDMLTTPGEENQVASATLTDAGTHYCGFKTFIGPAMAAQTLTGSFSVRADYREKDAAHNMIPLPRVYVWKADGSGVRGTISGAASAVEADTQQGTQQLFIDGWAVAELAVLEGDRIVAEMDSKDVVSTGSKIHGFGYNGAVDSGYDSYIEFSMDIAWKPEAAPETPTPTPAAGSRFYYEKRKPHKKTPRSIKVTEKFPALEDEVAVDKDLEGGRDEAAGRDLTSRDRDDIQTGEVATGKDVVSRDKLAHLEDRGTVGIEVSLERDMMRPVRVLEQPKELHAHVHELQRPKVSVASILRISSASVSRTTRQLIGPYEQTLVASVGRLRTGIVQVLGRMQMPAELAGHNMPRELDASRAAKEIQDIVVGVIYLPNRKATTDQARRSYAAGSAKGGQYLKGSGVTVKFGVTPADSAAVKLLQDRDLSALKGLSDDTSKRMVEVLTDGVMKGKGIEQLKRELLAEVDITANRARVIARTETMYAFNRGLETQYEKHGVEEVEWLTAYDGMCDQCEPLNAKRFKLGEAPDIPVHPQCRCILLPVIPEV